MARVAVHYVVDNWHATLNAAINDSVTTLVLSDSGASGCPSTSFYLSIDDEVLCCSQVQTDTPEAGKDTLTVSRGEAGTSASAHIINSTVEQNAYAIQLTELQNKIIALEELINCMLGTGEGVVRADSGDQLQVVEQDTPDMTVKTSAGAGIVSSQPVALTSADTSDTITAPSVNPRIDIVQINQSGTVSIKTGEEDASPSAPSVDSNNLKLAEIALTTATTEITNSEITDSRVFL